MILNFKQFVPSSVCMSCDGCCRFKEDEKPWRAHIAEEEKPAASKPSLPDKIFGPGVVDKGGYINTVSCGQGHICHFFNPQNGACGIYHGRPFECQLYPFVLSFKDQKPSVFVHLSCPFIQDHYNSGEYLEYVAYLKGAFGRDDISGFLKRNPDLFNPYEGYQDEIEYVFTVEGL